MSYLTPDRLEAMLKDYGWTFEATDINTWRTGFQGEQRLFPLQIKLTPTCVSFEVRPLIDLTIDGARLPVLSPDLLELNGRLQLVKVGINESGELSLSCQVLAAGFDAENLAKILGIIGYYADEVAPEIYHRLAAVGFYGHPTLLS